MREKLESLKKYDAVFFKNNNNSSFVELIKKNNSRIEIFNTFYKIKDLNKFDINKKYLIFSGIGNPKSFKKLLLENNFNIIDEIIYPDHFDYKTNDIENIRKQALDLDAEIITTEKDYVKILDKDR